MIQDSMIREIQELKLAGYSLAEAYGELKKRHKKVPTLKTVRKYYRMEMRSAVSLGVGVSLRYAHGLNYG